jgi:prepilin-type N-terminal cleavage/methylation domain-containing protein
MMNDEVTKLFVLKDEGRMMNDGVTRRSGSSFLIHHSSFRRRGFSLIEILVTIALLSFIVLGLFAMFNQTQRAFMSSMGQTDVLEAARTVTDMMTRDLEQLTPSGSLATNFLVRAAQDTSGVNDLIPSTQNLPGTNTVLFTRTNYLEDIFMLTRQNQTWTGIGYCVRVADPATGALYPAQLGTGQAGIGSLYRFTESFPAISPGGTDPGGRAYPAMGVPTDPSWLLFDFLRASRSGSTAISNRVCDGVVHVQVRSFATNGFPIYAVTATTSAVFRTNVLNINYSVFRQASAHYAFTFPDHMDQLFTWSNAVPAYLELELGIMEPRIFARFDSIPAAPARLAYFQRDDVSTRVQIYRQRIPIRNVDPAAYQ